MRHKIYRIPEDETERGTVLPTFLAYIPHYDEAQPVSRDGSDVTLEELVDLCDSDAEYHTPEFCGTHRLLGAVLYRQYGRKAATETMHEIALLGGLQGMNGVSSKGDAYEELGVGKAGHDWNGNYGE